MAADCCKGEPYMGDPNGLHTFECPAYQAYCDRVAALQRARPAPTADFDLPGTEFTSAALRRVELERDDARYQLKQMAEFRAEAIAAVRQVAAERDLARAELASAHTEMDATRTARDNLDRELAHTRRQLGDAIRELMDLGGVDLIAPLQPTEGAPKA